MYKKLIKAFITKNIGKFFIIAFCITLSLTGFLISDNLVKNIQTLIGNESKPILGGDIKIEPSKNLDEKQLNYLNELKNQNKIIISKKLQTYTTIVDKYNNPSLVSLVFVDEKYPLYGTFETTKNTNNSGAIISQNVQDLFVKDNNIEIFGKKYSVGAIIKIFPETSFNFFDDGKKIVLDLSEFDKLNLDTTGAKITREYLIKITNSQEFDEILANLKENKIFEGVRISDYKKGGDRFSDTFGELDKFIKYILIISFILTILIIFLSVEAFYIGNKKSFSILKILGIKNKSLIIFNVLLFAIIFIICFVLSIILSKIAFSYIRNFELSKDFYIQYLSIFKTSILGIIILGVSIFLPLLKFFSNNPLAGLKENFLQVYSKKEIIIETILVISGSILIYNLIIGNFFDSIIFTSSLFLGFFLIGYFLKYLLIIIYNKSNFIKKKNFAIYDSIRNTVKPGNLSLLIISSFIISFTSLFFISNISLNFLDKLNIDLNNNDNLYIINLNDEDIGKIGENYKKGAYSTILGRVLKINGKDLKEHLGENSESRRFTREFNITDNELNNVKIIDGNKIKSGEVSVDNNFSKELNLKIGDKIEFLIYGKNKNLTISNIRESANSSVKSFFYFQVYHGDFKDFPKTYFLATYSPLDKIKQFKTDFLQKTGNHISFIEIDQIVKEIKSISNKILIIIEILFSYIFIFCLLSLIISIIFLLPFKKNKSNLYNILGANRYFLKINNLFEYFYLQFLSFIISITISSIFSYYILSKSNFIDFTLYNYLISTAILSVIFIFLSFVIFILVGKIEKK